MRLFLIALLCFACKADPPDAAARVRGKVHTTKQEAFASLRNGLDEIYIHLRDHPGEQEPAMAKARKALTPFWGPDADKFDLYAAEGVWMLYGPRSEIWLARDDKALITDPKKLPPGAQAMIRSSSP